MTQKKGNGASHRSNGGSGHEPAPTLTEVDAMPAWASRMIDQERESLSKALVMARDEYEIDDDQLVVMLADMTSEFGAEMALAYHGDQERLADDVLAAESLGEVPVLVNVMPPPAWRAFFEHYVPHALHVMEDNRPSNTIALAVVGQEGVVVAFAERTLRVISPWELH